MTKVALYCEPLQDILRELLSKRTELSFEKCSYITSDVLDLAGRLSQVGERVDTDETSVSTQVTSVDLSNCKFLQDSGVNALSKHFPSLQRISVEGSRITDDVRGVTATARARATAITITIAATTTYVLSDLFHRESAYCARTVLPLPN